MPILKSHTAVELERNLGELRRKKELESLRSHIMKENCFHPSKDPNTCLIAFEDLKRLCRAWKLHEKRRNFWKTHTTSESMIDALLQEIRDTDKPNPRDEAAALNSSPPKPLFGALPPTDPKRSSSYAGRPGVPAANNRNRINSMFVGDIPKEQRKLLNNIHCC